MGGGGRELESSHAVGLGHPDSARSAIRRDGLCQDVQGAQVCVGETTGGLDAPRECPLCRRGSAPLGLQGPPHPGFPRGSYTRTFRGSLPPGRWPRTMLGMRGGRGRTARGGHAPCSTRGSVTCVPACRGSVQPPLCTTGRPGPGTAPRAHRREADTAPENLCLLFKVVGAWLMGGPASAGAHDGKGSGEPTQCQGPAGPSLRKGREGLPWSGATATSWTPTWTLPDPTPTQPPRAWLGTEPE